MWFLRKMMKIPWTDKVSNEEVLTRAGVQRKVIREMFIRQLKFMGHNTRKEGLENLALTGKIVGRRSRGRRRILLMYSLQKLLEERGVKEQGVVLIQKARSRGLWNGMIAKVKRYGRERERERVIRLSHRILVHECCCLVLSAFHSFLE